MSFAAHHFLLHKGCSLDQKFKGRRVPSFSYHHWYDWVKGGLSVHWGAPSRQMLRSRVVQSCEWLISTTYGSSSNSTSAASVPSSTSTGVTSSPILKSLKRQSSPASRPYYWSLSYSWHISSMRNHCQPKDHTVGRAHRMPLRQRDTKEAIQGLLENFSWCLSPRPSCRSIIAEKRDT